MKRTFAADFKELQKREQRGYGFQSLIKQIGIALGYDVEPGGVGADNGKDLVFVITEKGMYNKTSRRRWLVSCKDNSNSRKNKSVSARDLNSSGNFELRAKQHKCDGFLLACTTSPTENVVKLLKDVESPALLTHYWDGDTIENILQEHEETMLYTLIRFFPNSYASSMPLLSRLVENVIEMIELDQRELAFHDIQDLISRVQDISSSTNSSEVKQRLSQAVLWKLVQTGDEAEALYPLLDEWMTFIDTSPHEFLHALNDYLNAHCIPYLNLGRTYVADTTSGVKLWKRAEAYVLELLENDAKTNRPKRLRITVEENKVSGKLY